MKDISNLEINFFFKNHVNQTLLVANFNLNEIYILNINQKTRLYNIRFQQKTYLI